jgi:hypothetical protein
VLCECAYLVCIVCVPYTFGQVPESVVGENEKDGRGRPSLHDPIYWTAN